MSETKNTDKCYICKKEVPSDELVLVKDDCYIRFVCPHHHGVQAELEKQEPVAPASESEESEESNAK